MKPSETRCPEPNSSGCWVHAHYGFEITAADTQGVAVGKCSGSRPQHELHSDPNTASYSLSGFGQVIAQTYVSLSSSIKWRST
jgi:hypothetical protein